MRSAPPTGPVSSTVRPTPVARLARAQQRIRSAGLSEVLRVTAVEVRELCGADVVIVATADRDGDVLVSREVCGRSWPGSPAAGDRIPVAGTLAGVAVTSGIAQLCHDGGVDPRTDPGRNRRYGVGSSMAVPLTRDGVAVGVVSVLARERGRFDEDALAVAELTSGTASDRLAQLLQETSEAELHRTVLDALDEAVLVTRGEDLEVLMANAALRRMSPQSEHPVDAGDLVARREWHLYDTAGRPVPVADRPTTRARRSGERVHDVVLQLRLDGRDHRWLSVTALPVRDPLSHEVLSVVTRLRDVTAERAQRAELHTTEERLRAAQHVSGLAWWSYDAAADVHTWSEQMFAIAGLDPAGPAPAAAGFLALMHPDDRPDGLGCRRAERSGDGWTCRVRSRNDVFRLVRPDGSVRVVQSWSDHEHAPDGRLLRMHGATLDVTDREEAMAELARGDERFRLAFDHSPVGMGLIEVGPDREPRLVRANAAMVDVLGHLDEADLLARPASWSAPEVREQDLLALRAVVAGEVDSLQLQTLLARRDGSTFPAIVTASVSTDAAGQSALLLLHVIDITERDRAERDTARSERLFRAAFENAPSGMVVVSASEQGRGTVLRANRALGELLGVPADQVAGRQAQDFLVEGDRDPSHATIARVAATGHDSGTAHRRVLRPDGTHRDVYVSSTLLAGGEEPTVLTHVVDVTHQHAHQRTLEQMAMTDSMTGLANRVQLARWIDEALAGPPDRVALLMLDLDRFKNVNDSLGHDVGDQLLSQVADRLGRGAARGWKVARLGGDEFVVLLVDVDGPDQPVQVAEQVLAAVAEPYLLRSGHRIETTGSVGIALGHQLAPSNENLLRQADLALYAAKDSGRNRYAVCDGALLEAMDTRVGTEQMLRRGLDGGRLRVHLQPIVALHDRSLVALEALVRLDDPVEGLLLPARFIDVAEESGLITEIDRFVLAEAVRIGAGHPQTAGTSVRVAVNLSSRTLAQPDLVDHVRRLLGEHGVSGSRLLLEMTETGLLADEPALHRTLRGLTDLGAHLAIDDFGTGYSALAYLTRFEMHELKIDRAFVVALDDGSGVAAATVRAIIQLAHAHGMRVTAEGVETEAQAALLLAMGCDCAQGWLFGRPAPAGDRPSVPGTDLPG